MVLEKVLEVIKDAEAVPHQSSRNLEKEVIENRGMLNNINNIWIGNKKPK